MSTRIKLLVVDDEQRFLRTLGERLEMRDFDVNVETNGADALEAVRRKAFDLALVNLKMLDMDGEEVLARLTKKDPWIEVVILTGHGSIDSAMRTNKLRSHVYLQKPCETEKLLQALKDAYQKRVQSKLRMDTIKIEQFLQPSAGQRRVPAGHSPPAEGTGQGLGSELEPLHVRN